MSYLHNPNGVRNAEARSSILLISTNVLLLFRANRNGNSRQNLASICSGILPYFYQPSTPSTIQIKLMGLYKFQSDDAPDIYGEVIFESKDGVLVRRDSADLYSVWKPIEKKTLALGGFECLKTTYNKLEAIKMAEQLPVPPKMQ